VPGTYTLAVDKLERFAPSREEGLVIGAGAALDHTVVLKPAVSQSVTVEATRTIARTSGLDARFGQDYLSTIPTRRFSMFDAIKSAPGISPTSPSSGTINTVATFGSAVNENQFLIDGTNFTCPCQGVSRAEPSVDVIQEVHVQSTGASVEFGGVQGGVINVITRQGGARYQYDASYYGQPSSLTSQPVLLAPANGPATGYERIRYRDFTTNLGGPVVRDRLWFFGGYENLRDHDSQPGADPAFPRKYEQNKVFGKLTWKLSSTLRMMQSFHDEHWVNPMVPTVTVPFAGTQRVHASVPSTTFANLTQVLSNKTVWDVRVGRFVLDQKADPSSGDRTTPSHRDQISGVVSNNAPQIGTTTIARLTAKAVLNRYQPGWLGADHEFKIGVQFDRGNHQTTNAFPGGVQFVDSRGTPLQAIYRDPWVGGGLSYTSSLFASDSVTLNSRIAADAGVRFDHSEAVSPDIPASDAVGRPTSDVKNGLGSLYTWNVVSPRFGAVVKLSRDGRTLLRGTYGRFNAGVLTGELDAIHPGITPVTTRAFDATADGYTKLVSVIDSSNLALDRHTRTPHTDEYSIAFDREISPRLTTSVAYVGKRGSDFIGWVDTGGQYSEETRLLGDGSTVPVFMLTNGTASRRFLLTNPDGFFMHYDGLVVAVERRMAKNWQASGSYTFSRSYGLEATSNATLAEPQFSTVARSNFLTFGQDPNDVTNARGRLPNDRPHVFRATGVVHLPWKNVLVAATFQCFSGRPWAATAQVALPQSGRQRVLIEPRGSRRLSAQSLMDLRVAKTLALGSAGTLDLRLDVLNLLNDKAEETLQSDVLFDAANKTNSSFALPQTFMDPRRAMMSVKLNLGRTR
jgi:hypothetical protein